MMAEDTTSVAKISAASRTGVAVFLTGGIVALLAVAAYVNALRGPFVFDDHTEILQNVSIRDLGNLRLVVGAYPTRPLTNLTYAVGYAISGLNPVGYHAVSVVLHAANVALLWVLALSLFGGSRDSHSRAEVVGAFFAAALFAVHPLMTESVGYVSSQSELLYSTFFLAALLCLLRALTTGDRRATVAGIGLFLGSLAAKETAVVLPLVLVAADLLLIGGTPESRRTRFWRVHLPLLGLVLVLGLIRVWLYLAVEHPDAQDPRWQNAGLELHVVARYASLLFYPQGQTIVPPVGPVTSFLDSRVLAAAALLSLFSYLALSLRKREPVVTFGFLWFLLLLAPSAALIVVSSIGQPMAEHRAYLASAGLFLAVAVVVRRLWGTAPSRLRAGLLGAGMSVIVVLLFSLTIARNQVWQNPIALWEEAARRAPGTWMAHYGLAYAHLEAGNDAAAVPSLERVIALSPRNLDAYTQLGDVLIAMGRYERARTVLRGGVARVPRAVNVRLMLANLEAGAFRNPREALRLCQEGSALVGQQRELAACVARNQRGASSPAGD